MSYTKKKATPSALPYIITGTALALCIVIVLLFVVLGGNKKKTASNTAANSSTAAADNITKSNLVEPIGGKNGTLNANGDLEIPISTLTKDVTLYNFAAGNVTDQLIVLKDSAGNAKLAFNTCQVCNGSPYAYFVANNNTLQCQNCGNTFSTNVVGQSSGGCNPVPISGSNVKVEEGKIIVSKDFLNSKSDLFTKWKKLS